MPVGVKRGRSLLLKPRQRGELAPTRTQDSDILHFSAGFFLCSDGFCLHSRSPRPLALLLLLDCMGLTGPSRPTSSRHLSTFHKMKGHTKTQRTSISLEGKIRSKKAALSSEQNWFFTLFFFFFVTRAKAHFLWFRSVYMSHFYDDISIRVAESGKFFAKETTKPTQQQKAAL